MTRQTSLSAADSAMSVRGKATPAPWKWEEDQYGPTGLLHGPNGELVLNLHAVSINDQALIAASPLLLAACEKEGELDRHRDSCRWCNDDGPCRRSLDLQEEARQLRQAAIAAAKGGA